MLVDSHCHLDRLDMAEHAGSLDALLARSWESGLQAVLSVCVTLEEAQSIIDIAEKDPRIFASVGMHPSDVGEASYVVSDFTELASHPKVIAIGETGLDYHYNSENLEQMRDSFRVQIQVSRQIKKPLIIHTRAACDDTIAIMREEKAEEAGGVMHCFTETWDLAKAALDLGFYVSFSGIVTFKNAQNVVDVARQVPMDRLLIETDAPYLTPVPYRGKPNRPEYVQYVAEKIAEIKNLSVDEVIDVTGQNFCRCFHVSMPTSV